MCLTFGVGCAGDSPVGDPGRASSPSAVDQSAPSPASGSELESEEVSFKAEDGTTVRGRLWSGGEVGVVLAHGFSELTGQDDWLPWPGVLSEEGYTVLTFNFRGFCSEDGCSGGQIELGNNWMDLIAAIEYLEQRGIGRVFLVGGSMGGIQVFRVAEEAAAADFAGIVSISTPQFPSRYYPNEPPANDVTDARLRAIRAPKLFIAGDGDAQLVQGGLVRFADDAQNMFDAAADPKEILILDTSAHSHELVTSAEPEVVEGTREAILAFLATHA
jgi:pimeloyl-ACP methyl ester carboxylesterase